MKKLLVISFLTSLIATSQNNTDLSYYLPQDITYNKNIPTPESVIGHQVGEWHITHDKLAQYMYALANATSRITIENRGKTYEGRPLLLLTITSEKNHQKIDAIRETHINAMFEKRTTFQDSLFYDISAWSFPLAFNVDYSENISTKNIGEEVTNLKLKNGNVSGLSEYAYLMEWHEYYSPKILNKILSKDIRAKVALKQFSMNGKAYDYGTIMIPIQNQKLNTTDLHAFLSELAKESHIQIDAVNTGLTEGIDLGSRNFKTLIKPEIAMLVGDNITSYDAGEIWHLFDTRYDIKVTKLDTKSIGRADLSRYNTIIVPNSKSLDKSDTEKLKDWVKNRGVIIGYRGTVKWLKNKEFIKLEFKETSVPAKNISFEQKSDFSGAQRIGGAIFQVKLDRSHPINFGYKNDKIALFRNTTVFIEADSSSYNNPIQYTKNPLLSGYISKPNLEALSNTVPLQIKRLGRGKVVAFTDNTNFRAFWYGTNKLLMNAIFFRNEL